MTEVYWLIDQKDAGWSCSAVAVVGLGGFAEGSDWRRASGNARRAAGPNNQEGYSGTVAYGRRVSTHSLRPESYLLQLPQPAN